MAVSQHYIQAAFIGRGWGFVHPKLNKRPKSLRDLSVNIIEKDDEKGVIEKTKAVKNIFESNRFYDSAENKDFHLDSVISERENKFNTQLECVQNLFAKDSELIRTYHPIELRKMVAFMSVRTKMSLTKRSVFSEAFSSKDRINAFSQLSDLPPAQLADLLHYISNPLGKLQSTLADIRQFPLEERYAFMLLTTLTRVTPLQFLDKGLPLTDYVVSAGFSSSNIFPFHFFYNSDPSMLCQGLVPVWVFLPVNSSGGILFHNEAIDPAGLATLIPCGAAFTKTLICSPTTRVSLKEKFHKVIGAGLESFYGAVSEPSSFIK